MKNIEFSDNDKKWINALARTHSKFSIERNRLVKHLDSQIKANKNWKEAIEKYNKLIKMLLKTKRITKEELSEYITKKDVENKNSNN